MKKFNFKIKKLSKNEKTILKTFLIILCFVHVLITAHYYVKSTKNYNNYKEAWNAADAKFLELVDTNERLNDLLKLQRSAIEQCHYNIRKMQADCKNCTYTVIGDYAN